MTDIDGGRTAQPDFTDQQTAAAGGVEAVEGYEDAAAEARGEDPRLEQGDDEEFDDETGVDDEDDDEIDFDEDDEDYDDEDEELDEEEDDEDLRTDDDGNPISGAALA